jgi:hypothetical protein
MKQKAITNFLQWGMKITGISLVIIIWAAIIGKFKEK